MGSEAQDTQLEKLKSGVLSILDSNLFGTPIAASELMALYSLCYQLCCGTSVDQAYKTLGLTVDDYLHEKLLKTMRSMEGERLLQHLSQTFERYKGANKAMAKSFAYMERYYLKKMNMPLLAEAGLSSFRLLVLDPLLPNIKEAMYSIIKSFRDSGAGDLSLLSGTVRVLIELDENIYVKEFEQQFVRDTKAYFQSCRDQSKESSKILETEKEISKYLHPTTEPLIIVEYQKLFTAY